MKSTFTLISIYFYALLSSGTTSRGNEDKQWLDSLVELVELEYEDHCEKRATATWNELIGSPDSLFIKLERDKSFGIFSRTQTNDIKEGVTEHSLIDNDNIVKRKVNLLLKTGDFLLDTEDWIKLVTYGDSAANRVRFASDYDCGTGANCTLRELHNSLARQQDEEILHQMKMSWEEKLPDYTKYLNEILPLTKKAAQKNGYNTVESYWDFLAEYEGAILKARELWEQIKPLYAKLHKYIALRLKGPDATGKVLPVHLLKSLHGDDWSNIIESLLPKRADIYQKIHANIQLKELGGLEAFKAAAHLIDELNLGELKPAMWSESLFNGSCPTVMVDFCKSNKVKAITCRDVSIRNYMEAHESIMKMKYKQQVASYSNNSYILREANRHSAVYEAISGFASLIALNPYALDRSGLYPIGRFNYNPNYHRIVLQLIMALKDLPKLNYYLAVDEWRLKVLMGDFTPSNITISWSEFRKNFSLLETSDVDVVGDPYVIFNKPYVGKFMGIILKYQIYQSFAEELKMDESDLVKHVSENNYRLTEAMAQGYAFEWPELVSDLLAQRENGLEYTGVTDYYTLLDEYLDRQLLNPSSNNIDQDDYIEPPIVEPTESFEANEIPIENTHQNAKEKEIDTHEDIVDNTINTNEESNSKYGTDTSTVGVLEIKNPVAAGDKTAKSETKEASYSTYWWIGIVIALSIIVILIAIIAKKRQSHRKQLERQRRNNTSA